MMVAYSCSSQSSGLVINYNLYSVQHKVNDCQELPSLPYSLRSKFQKYSITCNQSVTT